MPIPMNELTKNARDAYEKGKKDTFIPQDPFISFGFEKNPFSDTSIDDLKQETFIQSRIRKVAFSVGKVISSQSEDKVLDGIIIGISQNGISTLVDLTLQLLKENAKELKNAIYLDAKNIVESENNRYLIAKSIQNFRNHLAATDTGEPISLVIIDHADFLVDFYIDFRENMEFNFPETPFIFVLTSAAWARLKSYCITKQYDIYNHTLPSLYIDPLTKNEIEQILNMKLGVNGQIQQPFTKEIITLIATESRGSIINAIKICVRVCEDCFYNGLDFANQEIVIDISSFLGINLYKEFKEKLTLDDNSRIFIMSLIAMKSIANDLGITYDEIANNVGLKKTTISYHLSYLSKIGMINKQTINRKAYYRIIDVLKTAADTLLLPKFEAKEHYVKFETISDSK